MILSMVMCTEINRQTRQQARDDTRCDHSGAHERAARCGSAAGEGGGGVHAQSWWKVGKRKGLRLKPRWK